MKGWLPRFAILNTGTPGLMDDDSSFFYGRALVIQWGEFVVELTFARSDEVTK
jgi:hypothetical protein